MFSPAQSGKVSLGAVSGMLCAALLQGRPSLRVWMGAPSPVALGAGCCQCLIVIKKILIKRW